MVVETPLKIVSNRKKSEDKATKLSPLDIKRKLYKMSNAMKIPPFINQFKTTLEGDDEERVINLFKKYMVESKEDKIKRLNSENPRAGPKPIISKFGLKHLTSLIVQKKIKLLLIASDVNPINLVCWLPTLCVELGISYAIVKKQSTLGALARLKRVTAIGIEDVRPEDKAEFDKVIEICDGIFKNQYEKHSTTFGGGKINLSKEEVDEAIKEL